MKMRDALLTLLVYHKYIKLGHCVSTCENERCLAHVPSPRVHVTKKSSVHKVELRAERLAQHVVQAFGDCAGELVPMVFFFMFSFVFRCPVQPHPLCVCVCVCVCV